MAKIKRITDLKIQHFVLFITILIFLSCHSNPVHLKKTDGLYITVNDSPTENPSIESFIPPFRLHVNTILDSTLAYAQKTFIKDNGQKNTLEGNLGDIVREISNPIFKSRTRNDICFVLLNHGGILSTTATGNF